MTALPPLAKRTEDQPRATVGGSMATILDPDDVALAAILADAGRILGSSLDSAATLRQIADLIVPAMADWCAHRSARRGWQPRTPRPGPP